MCGTVTRQADARKRLLGPFSQEATDMSLFDELKAASDKGAEVEVEAQTGSDQPRWSGPYDVAKIAEILEAAVELHGGESDWEINYGVMENQAGRNSKGQPRMYGALKTKEHSAFHPGNIEAYNGNRGAKLYLNGFTAEEAAQVLAAA